MTTNQKPPEKKIEKVVTGNVTIKKKSALAKIRDMFIAEDADKVGSYILMDVLVPSIKKAIVDIIKSSADMIFGTKGSSKPSGSTYTYGGTPYVSYSSVGKKPEPINVARSQYEVVDIIFDNRSDAEEVLDKLGEEIDLKQTFEEDEELDFAPPVFDESLETGVVDDLTGFGEVDENGEYVEQPAEESFAGEEE